MLLNCLQCVTYLSYHVQVDCLKFVMVSCLYWFTCAIKNDCIFNIVFPVIIVVVLSYFKPPLFLQTPWGHSAIVIITTLPPGITRVKEIALIQLNVTGIAKRNAYCMINLAIHQCFRL